MKNIKTIPSADGYHMPAEYACHKGCILIWPQRPGSWKKNPEAAEKAFCAVMQAIAESEAVYLACGKAALPRAKAFADEYNRQFQREISEKKHFPVVVFEAETDDAWARDIGPTFVVKDDTVRGISWTFNAWGACMPHGRKMMLLRQHLQREKAMSVMMPLPLYWKVDLFTVTVKGQ